MNKKKVNRPVLVVLIIIVLIGLAIVLLKDKKFDEPFAIRSTTTETEVIPSEEETTTESTVETTAVTESEETVPETSEVTEVTTTPAQETTPTETTDVTTTETSSEITEETEPTVLYTEQAGSYYRYYDITNIYHRLAAEQGYEIPDPDATVGASFSLTLSEDGYFSISGNTSNAADSLAPVVGAGIYNAAASASASGTYTVSGTSITFYANDGRVVSGTITGSCVSFVTPEPYAIQLALYR